MKKSLVALLALVFVGLGVYAQAPSKFNYQAVVRDNAGIPLNSEAVSIRISILQGSSSGTDVYSEEHSPTTNAVGLVSMQIGNGSNTTGNFDDINWGSDSYYVKVELDADGGSNYSVMTTSQLVSVPYALFAETVANDSVMDDDSDPMNEIQTLAIVGDSLVITSGNAVYLPEPVNNDNDSTNELQTLSLSGNDLMLSNGGGTVDLSDYDQSNSVDSLATEVASNTTDIATNASDISTNASDISTNASDIATNASDIADVASDLADHVAADMDVDSTNELLTDFVWDGDSTLTITEAGADWDVNLSSLIDDDDWVRAGDTIYNDNDMVGIGTDGPAATLHVKGGNAYTNITSGSVIIGDGDSAHLAFDNNDIYAKYGADSTDRLWLQRRGNLSVGNWYHTAYKAIFSTDSNDYDGGFGGIFNYRDNNQGNNGWVALYNYNNSSHNAGNTFGVINYNLYSDSVDFGVYNFNYANGFGNSYGTYNELLYSADTAFGTYNLINQPQGNTYGSYNWVKAGTPGYHHGAYTRIDSGYQGVGYSAELYNNNYSYGTYSNSEYAGYAYGNYNRVYYPQYGYGDYNYVYYPTYYGYGSYNLIQANNGYTQYGVRTSAYNYGTGQVYGNYTYAYATNSTSYGSYNIAGGRYSYGSYNQSSYPTYYGYGSRNNAYGSSTYTQYGSYNYAYSSGGSSYASYNQANTYYTYGTAIGSYNYSYGGGTYDYVYGVYGYASSGYYQNWAGYFAGTTYSSGGYSSSDAKLKSDIRDLEGGLDAVMRLKARRYSFDTESYPTMGLPEEEQIGVIAQELEEVFPELVTTAINQKVRMDEPTAKAQGLQYEVVQEAVYDSEGELVQEAEVEAGDVVEFKAVRYESLIPVLIKAIQEQQEIIEGLESRIDQLEN